MNTKTVRNNREPLKKPRPLKSSNVEQPKDIRDSLTSKARSDILLELETLNVRISNGNLEEGSITADISLICSLLKKHGEELDASHKEALDRFFCTLRNACREDRLDVLSRLKLLEIIEFRAMHWKMNENICNYFNSRYTHLEEASEHQNTSGSLSPNTLLPSHNQNFANVGVLAPGEFLRSSGKFSKPTKIAGKNYFKDEIVIRNCDSGKVNAGARDRLVQITGPDEAAIGHAKFLVEDTIKRNVSPVRDNLNMSEIAVDNKEHIDYGTSFFDRNSQPAVKRNLTHSYSMSDATTKEFTIPVYVGNDVIKLSGVKSDLLKIAKSVLLEYFAGHFDTSEEDSTLPSSKSASMVNSNQRFILKKQTSLKDNLHSSFEHNFSRQSSSMSSSSDEMHPDEESSDLETVICPDAVPIPPPRNVYSRQFLLECARLPLSHKCPPEYEQIATSFPEIIPQSPVMFDPSQCLQNENAQ